MHFSFEWRCGNYGLFIYNKELASAGCHYMLTSIQPSSKQICIHYSPFVSCHDLCHRRVFWLSNISPPMEIQIQTSDASPVSEASLYAVTAEGATCNLACGLVVWLWCSADKSVFTWATEVSFVESRMESGFNIVLFYVTLLSWKQGDQKKKKKKKHGLASAAKAMKPSICTPSHLFHP